MAATEILPCGKGTVSYYTDAGVRVPDVDDAQNGGPDKCAACTLNTYAPRDGMANCLPCKGGYKPNTNHDGCDVCGSNTYRSFYTAE